MNKKWTDIQKHYKQISQPPKCPLQINSLCNAGYEPESVIENGALIKLIARVQQFCGNDRRISERRGFPAHLLTVNKDVFAMGPENY